MATIDIGDVHKNSKLLWNRIPHNVDEAEFMKPGKGRAIYRLRLRNLIDNTVVEYTFHSGDKVEEADIANVQMQYLYKEGDQYIFMNTQSFEQYPLDGKIIGDKKNFLKEGIVVTVTMLGEKAIDVVLPTFVELMVKGGSVATRTDSLVPQNRAVELETGATIGVPSFVKEGDVIKVDTRTGTYVERITTKK